MGLKYSYYSSQMELEANRLGFSTKRIDDLTFYTNGIRFFRSTSVPDGARDITKDKVKTKNIIGCNTPKYYVLKKGEEEEVPKLPFPLVLKPISETGSAGVYVNINSHEEYKKVAKLLLTKRNSIMVEEYIEGEKYRVLVTDEKILSIVKLIPQTVIGDGVSTISKLIKQRNEERRIRFSSLPTYILQEVSASRSALKRQGFSLNSVLKKGEKFKLRELSSVSTGASCLEFFDELVSPFTEICVNSVKAVPGLKLSGTDIIVDRHGNQHIIELNSWPSFRSHMLVENVEPKPVIREVMRMFLGVKNEMLE